MNDMIYISMSGFVINILVGYGIFPAVGIFPAEILSHNGVLGAAGHKRHNSFISSLLDSMLSHVNVRALAAFASLNLLMLDERGVEAHKFHPLTHM